MKKTWMWVSVAVAAAVLFATNPSAENHQTKLAKVLTETLVELGEDEGGVLGLAAEVCGLPGFTEALGDAMGESFERKNLGVCGIGYLDGDAASFGVLGMVFTAGKAELKREARKAMQELGEELPHLWE